MKLYLASAAINVMDELVQLLPAPTSDHTACYITTAGNLESNPHWIDEEISAVEKAGYSVKRIDLAKLSFDNVEAAFRDCHSIWVGGGNTYLLLQEVRRTGFDALVLRKIDDGIPYIGTSAGSLIMGPNLESIRFAEQHPALDLQLNSFDGLNVFPLLPFVHFDNPDYRDVYRQILNDALEKDVAFVTLRDNQFIFVDGDNWRIISSD
jgi:dipeptidase E